MSKIIAQLVALFALFLVQPGSIDSARAQGQSIGAGKQICIGDPIPGSIACTAPPATGANPGVPLGVSVYYMVTLTANSTTPSPVSLVETYPTTGFTFLNAQCYVIGSTLPIFTVTSITNPGGTPLGPVPVLQGQQVVCVINGFFDKPGLPANNTVNVVDVNGAPLGNAQVQATVQQNPVLPSDLSITKSVSTTYIDVSAGPATLTYTIQIKNHPNGATLYLGSIFELSDQLALPLTPASVPLKATYVPGATTTCVPSPGSHCLATTPLASPLSIILPTSTLVPFKKWRFPTAGIWQPGKILPGGTITLKYDVKIERLPQYDCVIAADGVRNQAFLTLASGTTAIGEQNPINPSANTVTNNTAMSPNVMVFTGATINDPQCGSDVLAPPPVLKVTKKQVNPTPPTLVPWGGSATYEITITNTSGSNVTLTSLRDFIEEDPGTPLFKATLVASACSPPSGPGTGTGVQQLQGYYSTKQVWNGPNLTVPGGQSVTCKLTVKFSDQTCDSWHEGPATLITNIAQVKYQATVPILGVPTLVTYTLYAKADTPMAQADICKFAVTKKLNPSTQTKIIFNTPVTYQVTFKNNETVSRIVGTLGDFLRIVQNNYATSMPITYSYQCTLAGSVIGFGALNIPNTLGLVVNTALASQGVQILHKTNVKFAPGASVTCNIKVTVKRPPVNDPFCLSSQVPQLENLALMDISPFYNPNMNWPPTTAPATYSSTTPLPLSQPPFGTGPVNWATITLPLPKCFHLEVNKSRNPTTTMTMGGPITYTLTIKNLGDNLLEGLGTSYPWVLQDVFLPPNNNLTTATSPNPLQLLPSCGPGLIPDCTWLAAPFSGSTNPYTPPAFKLGINNFPGGSTLTVQFTVNPLFNLTQVCNIASVFMQGATVNQDWYANNYLASATTPEPQNPPYKVCTPITVPTSLQVTKKTQYLPGVAVPNPAPSFPLAVNCTPNGPSTTLTITDGGALQPVNNIPSGSNCTITETVTPVPSNYPSYCKWVPTLDIDGVNHPNPFTITNISATPNPHYVTVLNKLICTPPTTACVLDPGMFASNNTFKRRATLAQTFTPTQTGSLTTITHSLQSISGVQNYDLLVTTTTGGLPSWTGGPTTTPNVLLAMTGVTIFSNSSMVNGIVPIPTNQQPHLTAGTQYALILIPGTPTTGDMAWQGNAVAGSYPNGSAYELNGTTWNVPGIAPKDHGFKLDGQCP